MNNLNTSALTTTAPIIIENVNIRQDEQGRFCLNDLHKAAGGLKRHQPNYWVNNAQTQELIAEMTDTGIPVTPNYQPIEVIRGGLNQGTYVDEDLVYQYAMWVSPKFNLKVIRTFKAVTKGQLQPLEDENLIMAKACLIAQDTIKKQETLLLESQKQIAEMQPKADFVSHYVEARGTSNLEETAKILKIKPRTFTRQLREDRVLFYNVKGNNVPYQTYLDRGYFVVKTALNSAERA
ncbi:KilA-N domain-containing protein [Spartinivicinus ruber]|uniref:KilA-N domain-containing protein n=1 Tax=Spartinivicinus ruber TaxID=2683272 RepID=UPI0013D27DF9|nr:KilA-N domain-containing protein [Spartinivicinus ruber]